MGEQPEPVKEEQKKNILTLTIDLDALAQPHKIDVPQNQIVWNSQEEMSEDYQKFMNVLGVIMVYVARSCNEGPEVKDNISKRMITVKTLLDMFFQNLCISGYMTYGVLTELLYDYYMRISGKQQTISLLKRIQKKTEIKSKEKSKQPYIS